MAVLDLCPGWKQTQPLTVKTSLPPSTDHRHNARPAQDCYQQDRNNKTTWNTLQSVSLK